MQAFSVVQQYELDGPLLPDEALELQVGSGRRKAAGASAGKRRAVSTDEPQLLRFCARGVTVGRVPASVAKWLQPLLAEGKVEVQAAVLQACYLVITPRGMVEVQAAVLQAPRSCRLA